jgi:FAD/FMN-containing dehydrogenase
MLALHDRHAAIDFAPGITSLPYGNGRSYGDSCLNDGGRLLATRGLDRFIAFDAATGVLECEAGMLLTDIITRVLPQGWFLPVTPGTQFVTVGGAIANDVHGKNHHRAGSFGRHLLGLDVLRSSGERLQCSAQQNSGLFAATIGGLGLTGLILSARLQLRRCPGPAIAGESLRLGDLGEFFARSRESDHDWEYTVAWVDCLARGAALGRGLLLRGNHFTTETPPAAPDLRLTVPFDPPVSLIGPVTLKAFNAAYAHRPGATGTRLWHYQPFFYPLDGVRQWNRLYGPRGFYQYQCVLPMHKAEDGLRELLRSIAASGEGSFLAVLKLFGDLPSPGLLSFPRQGATLALDFPNRGSATLQLLDRLDTITLAAGGALYPAKDARMSAAMFRASFPALDRFLPYLDPAMSSSFWRRVQPPGNTTAAGP